MASPVFGASDRLKRLLRYLVESTLAGEGASLKEYSIGLDVFDRGKTYDPRIDSTVRVNVAKLRDRLREYYLSEGREAAVTIELPKGVYTPVFRFAAHTRAEAASPKRRPLALVGGVAAMIGIAIGALAGRWSVSEPLPAIRALTFKRGTVTAGRFIPGSRDLLYSASWQGRNQEIFSVRQGVSESRSLGLDAAQLLSISRRGDLAVLKNPAALNVFAYTGTIATTNLAGIPTRDLLENGMEADYSPQADELAVVRHRDQRATLELPPGKPLYEQTVGSIRFPRFSSSGDLIAFADRPNAVLGDTRGSVAITDLRGRRQTLTREWSSLSGLAWLPGRKEIWFSAAKTGYNNDLYSVDLSGRLRTLWTNAGTLNLLDVGEDGSVLASRDDVRTGVAGCAPHETDERDLSWLDAGFTRALSDDGQWLLLEESGEGAGENGVIYLRKMAGEPPIRLATGFPVALSHDAKWVLGYRRDSKPPRPFLVPTGAGEAQWFDVHGIEFDETGAWFPDSKHVLLSGQSAQTRRRNYSLDIATGKMQPITPEGVWGHLVSPDGQWILLDEPFAKALNLETGQIKELRGFNSKMAPVGWTDEPSSIWIREGDLPSQVSRLNIVTGAKRPWKVLRPNDFAGAVNMSWIVITPDGQAYAYSYFRVLSELYLLTGLRR